MTPTSLRRARLQRSHWCQFLPHLTRRLRRRPRETGAFDGPDRVPVTLDMPAGWENWDFMMVNSEPAPPWRWRSTMCSTSTWATGMGGLVPAVGPTVDDLVSAYANIPGLDVGTAVDITVDGHAGTQIEFTVPDFDEDQCSRKFALWRIDGSSSSFYAEGPTQRTVLRIIDVNGTRLVITTLSFPDTPPQILPRSMKSWPPSRSAERGAASGRSSRLERARTDHQLVFIRISERTRSGRPASPREFAWSVLYGQRKAGELGCGLGTLSGRGVSMMM